MGVARRSVTVAALLALSLTGWSAASPRPASAVSCSGQPDGDADFNGDKQFSLSHPKGTAASIQAKNPNPLHGHH